MHLISESSVKALQHQLHELLGPTVHLLGPMAHPLEMSRQETAGVQAHIRLQEEQACATDALHTHFESRDLVAIGIELGNCRAA